MRRAREVRPLAPCARPRRGDRLCARRLSRHGTARARDRAARRRQLAERPCPGDSHPGRRPAARGRQARESRARAGAGADRGGRARGVLRRRYGQLARELLPGGRRIFRRGGLSRAAGELGRAAVRELPRRRDLRDARADPGLYRAGDAQPHRALRDRQDGCARPRARPPAGAGEADRLPRPRQAARRPRVPAGSGRPADLEAVRRRAPATYPR